MIPASYTHLAALPMTRGGKVQVRSLRGVRGDPGLPGGEPAAAGLEARICGIWRTVLGVRRAIGPDEDFLALGGDSLLAAQVLARVEADCGIRLSLAAFFDAATPARQAAAIAQAQRP
jgi:hypothetical protein